MDRRKKRRIFENTVHGVFLVLGLITVACVLVITVYLVISGLPAIAEIGLFKFLFGKTWASTAAEPSRHWPDSACTHGHSPSSTPAAARP